MKEKQRHLTMKELPVTERPYEKCEKNGAETLSDAELLAIVIKTGTSGEKVMDLAVQLLNLNPACQGLEGIMRLNMKDFQRIRGIGRVKSVQLAAVCELARRMTRIQFRESYIFDTPQSVADYYMAYMCHLKHEEVHVMMLDTKQHMICECLLTKGTVNASLIAPREIFVQALKADAVGIVLVHNHPSGDDTPSREDLAATEKVRCAGDLVGIRLIDHIIIGNGRFTSLCGIWQH